MPRINIYEHSETYSFQTRNNAYATVAFPIAAIWGPTFIEGDEDSNPDWVHFSAGFRGTTDFVQTFQGANNYLGSREKSYDYALKLLASGYDILVKRVDGLGQKSYNNHYVVDLGSTNAAASSTLYMVMVPDARSIPSSIEYDKIPYRFYAPRANSGKVVWSFDTGIDSLRYQVYPVVKNPETGKWSTTKSSSTDNQFQFTAKSITKDKYIVAVGKPTIITTQIVNLSTDIVIGSGARDYEKKVVTTGSVPISVYTDTGTLLERRNITITESSVYHINGNPVQGIIRVESAIVPEFSHITIDAIPALLNLKATYKATTKNLFSSDSGDADYGLFTFRLGTDGTYSKADLIVTGESKAAAIPANTPTLSIQAKFPGTFGNRLKVRIKCSANADGYKVGTVEVFDNNGYFTNPNEIVPTDKLMELVSVAFDEEAATDNRPLITQAHFSNLDTPAYVISSTLASVIPSDYPISVSVMSLYRGSDYIARLSDAAGNNVDITADDVRQIVAERFDTDSTFYGYISDIAAEYEAHDQDALVRLYNQQMLYKRFYKCMDELTDPIIYDWDALVQGIADDQYVPKAYLDAHPEKTMEYEVSTLVTKMLEVAANSKCGAALIGTPFGMPRGIQTGTGSFAVRTGALAYKDHVSQAVGTTYSTFGEVVGPWCKTTLALAGSNSWVAPEIAHLLLIINAKGVGGQNKWWMIPAGMLGSGIVHSPEYKIKKNYLDLIQNHDEGVCLNPLMEVPGKGFTCFGNSTLWDKPPGTYNALQNLSTRFLTNRVKQRIWDTALQILFKYNNEDAYSHFYAGLSPLLDEMRAVGALTGNEYNPWGYRIIMNPDIINLDRINANTVIGKVELAVTGVIDTVDVDLFLLPPTGFMETYD